MSPAHVLEPTYQRLKRALMEGAWPDGAKLEAMRLADEFGVSMTPVRDCLNQLVGEGLVELTPGEGFRVSALTEQRLRDLLEVNAALLEIPAEGRQGAPSAPQAGIASDSYAERMTAAFSIIASRSGNRVVVDLVARISERLHRVRTREPGILPGAQEMLAQIVSSLRASPDERRRVLRRYHKLCREHVSRLVDSSGR